MPSHHISNRQQLLSAAGSHLAQGTGIGELMDDLGAALVSGDADLCMLGGGNPAHIPQVEAVWQQRMREISEDPVELRRILGTYDPPRGNAQFIQVIVDLLREQYGWPVTPEHVAITNGGQAAFYCLFNLLAGATGKPDPATRKILLPMTPEYIGYANQGVGEPIFASNVPHIIATGPHEFRYEIDFDRLSINETIAAICVSRPCNPTGNVLSDDQLQRLSLLAQDHDIPLIIDNAYGLPFPGILYTDATPTWAKHHIQVISLSKLGLPGARTAVVIAPPHIAAAISSMTAVTSLANGNLGQAILKPLIASGQILQLCKSVIQPYYQAKLDRARAIIKACFPDQLPYALHESGGALFLWLWLRDCPVQSMAFYHRLKAHGVLVVPGDYFFFGSEADGDFQNWPHRHQCLRISFAMPDTTVEAGLQRIAEEIKRAYRGY